MTVRRSRPLLAALAALLVVVGAGCDPDDLNDMLDTYADGASSAELASGVQGASVRLTDGRTVVFTNDAYVGPVDGNGDRSATKIANALVVHSLDENEDDVLDTLKGTTARGHLKPPDSATNTYTVLGAVAASADIQVFVLERTSAGATVGVRIVRVLQSGLTQTGTPVSVPTSAGGAEWGSAVFQHEDYWYIYGEGSSGAQTYVARTPVGALTTTASWRYWTGSYWTATQSAAGPLRDWSGAVVARYLAPAVDSTGQRIVFLGRSSATGGAFTWYSAARPTGPLTAGGTAFTAPEAGDPCGTGGTGTSRVVDLSYHPHLSDATDDVWSYAHTCSTATTQADEHRPVFFGADLAGAPTTPRWRASWSTSQRQAFEDFDHDLEDGFGAWTLRQMTHLTRGGDTFRVRLSNRFGDEPLTIGDASFAVSTAAAGSGAAVTATPLPLTFAGADSVTIPVGHSIMSDAVTLPSAVADDHDVAISLHFPSGTGIPTGHQFQFETSWVGSGNLVNSVAGTSYNLTTTNSFFVAGVDVVSASTTGVIVGLGDSMTDGFGGTGVDAHEKWTDVLFDRLETTALSYTVVNEGVVGARLQGGAGSGSGLDRLQRDVLDQPGARTLVVWLGHNDITAQIGDADTMIDAMQELTGRADDAGLRVIVATVGPLAGPTGTIDPVEEWNRQVFNNAIRADQVGADAYVDFDAVLRDGSSPARVKSAYSAFSGSHPNAAGNAAMAEELYDMRAQL